MQMLASSKEVRKSTTQQALIFKKKENMENSHLSDFEGMSNEIILLVMHVSRPAFSPRYKYSTSSPG
ncbi:hypothetical protein GA0116948_103101 [Chitinophaga costaii]|uniref:Uncharacterized protein n=1 Tax=Chitinophaga costaii TaxID=1335309 RepID=A0A1C4BI34_9BACT|nr:hypothetical protein GA0116948_103101 [Chitinophaga costaii]